MSKNTGLQSNAMKIAAYTSALGCGILCVISGMTAAAGAGADPLIRPGMYGDAPIHTKICGKKAEITIYGVPLSAKTAEYLSFYKTQLKNYHYVHQTWQNRAQESLYSPDGTRGVSLTSVQNGEQLDSVSFATIEGGLTTHQMDAFSPTNGDCK